jgi:hypothetical protein
MAPELTIQLIESMRELKTSIDHLSRFSDGYLSKQQAADYFGCSMKSIERFMKAGLRYYLMTSEPHFTKKDLDDFARQFRKGAA